MTTRLNRSLGLAGAIAMLVLGLMIVRAQAQQTLQCSTGFACALGTACTLNPGTCPSGSIYSHTRTSGATVRSCQFGTTTCAHTTTYLCYVTLYMVADPDYPGLGGCGIVKCSFEDNFTGCPSPP